MLYEKDIANNLPVKGDMKLVLILSYMIAFLFIFNSIHGLVFSKSVYNSPELFNSFAANDIVGLFFAAPFFLISIIFLNSNKLIGLIGWSASLLFILYNYIVYLVSMRFIFNIIINSVMLLFCVISLIKILLLLDQEKLEKWKSNFKSVKVFAGIINAMGLVFIARALVNIIYFISGKLNLSLPVLAVNIADLLICPIWVFSSFQLTFRNRLGYFSTIVSYLHASILFVSLFIYMLIKPVILNTQFVLADSIVIGVIGFICIITFIIYIRKILMGKSPNENDIKKNQRQEDLSRWNKLHH